MVMHPVRLFRSFLVVLCAAVAALAQGKVETPKPGKAVEVVFVGNSYTHFHDLPAMVRALGAAQQPPRTVTTVMLAPGGFTLQGHWEASGAEAPRTVLGNRKPDFVVLQEQSHRPIDDAAAMQKYGGELAKLVKARGAVPVWYMTWARQDEPTAQDRLAAEYEKAQRDHGGLLAPVGRAWQRVLKDGKLPLHEADGSHPNPAGTYLAACVLYATMCGGDVATFPDKLVAKGDDGKEKVLVELPAEVGKALRTAAAAVVAAKAKKPK